MHLKSLFVITVLTARMIMPGMPQMPAGMNMPGMGSPTRTLTLDLTSPKDVDAKSTAVCAIPEGLKLGPKLDLQIDLPTLEKGPIASDGLDKEKMEKTKFVMKSYWDCAEVVPAGQPKITDSEKMMGELPNRNMNKQPVRKATVRHMGDPSHAYWPGDKPKPIKDDASLPGLWELTTNYCGGTTIMFDKDQDFLAPIEVISPGKGEIDLAKTIKIEWKSVPNAQGYLLSAFSSNKTEMVMWTSSSEPEVSADFASIALSKSEIKDYISRGILIPPATTSCRIPAGIFKDTGMPMITVTAFGVDKIQEKDGIRTLVTIRSTANLMLSAGMGMDEPKDEATEKTDTGNSNSGDAANKPADNTEKPKNPLGRLGNIFKRK